MQIPRVENDIICIHADIEDYSLLEIWQSALNTEQRQGDVSGSQML